MSEGRSESLTLDQAALWQAAVEEWPPERRDAYFAAGYHRAFASESGGEATLFVYRQADECLAYPFILRAIARVGDEPVAPGLHDIEGVYGFSGPIATTDAAPFLDGAWQAFTAWARERGVVAEFVRFNPLLRNERFMSAAARVVGVREHVVLDLRQTMDLILAGYRKTNRGTLRKAEQAGLEYRFVPATEVIADFGRLYKETMDRNRAAPGYYFSESHFETLAGSAPLYAGVCSLQGSLLAVSLFLLADDRIHYHLSGCSLKGLALGANNLILHRTIAEAQRRGLRLFHFGGGRTGDPRDSLLSFKAGFSDARVPAHVGQRVHDVAAYERLCTLRRRQSAGVPASFFLAYRWDPPEAGRP